MTTGVQLSSHKNLSCWGISKISVVLDSFNHFLVRKFFHHVVAVRMQFEAR